MISVPSNYDSIITGGGAYEWRVLNGSNTFTIANLISGRLTSSIMEALSIGNTDAMQLDLEMRDVTIDATNPLVLQFRAVGDAVVSDWVTRGTFYVDTVEKSPYSEITKVTAYDSMLKSEVTYSLSGGWISTTDKAVVQDIAAEMGVSIESSTQTLLNTTIALNNAPNVGPNGVTDRQMLSYIGVLRGGNWRMTADNKLMLQRAYTTPSATASIGDAVEDFDASPAETVKRIKVIVDAETYYLAPVQSTEDAWLAIGGRCLEVNLPFWGTQAVANDLLSKFNNKVFYPYNARNAYVDPKYTCGDGITIKDVTSVIVSQTINIDALASSDMAFKGEEAIQSLYPYVSPSERNIMYIATKAQDTADSAASAASDAATTANGAIYREQTIYINKASASNPPAKNTTWVAATDPNNVPEYDTWSTIRPVYRPDYPVLFVATQTQTMAQKGGTTCSCTTPVVDQTTTIIDGGHITTGTIDAGVVNVTNINASNISTGTLSADRIGAGSIAIGKLDSSTQNTINTASSNASTALTNAAAAQTTANKAVKATVSCYYRSTTNTAPSIDSSTSITTYYNTDNTWSYLMPYPKKNCYYFTCEKYTLSDNTVTFSTVRALKNADYTAGWCSSSNATYIDGGQIYTGSITANAIAANTITVSKLTGSISNGNWKIDLDNGTFTIGNISASNITTGTLNANNVTISGTISDTGNKNSWNLSTGQFTTTQGKIGGWTIGTSDLTASKTTAGVTYSGTLSPTALTYSYSSGGDGGRITVSSDDADLRIDWIRSGVAENALHLYPEDAGGMPVGHIGSDDGFLVVDSDIVFDGDTGLEITSGTTSGPVLTLGTSTVTVPSASSSQSGVVTTGAQTFEGQKTFAKNPLVGTGSEAVERLIQVQSNSGNIALESVGNANGDSNRGVWLGAHGTATAGRWMIRADKDNNVFIGTHTVTGALTLNYGNQYTQLYFRPTTAPTEDHYGAIVTNVGNASQPTTSQFYFVEPSVGSADGVTTGYFERYYLPASNANMTADASYDILTTKGKKEIPANGSITLTMSGSARALVITNGGLANQRGAYILYQGGSVKTITSASNISTSYSGSTATFTSSASGVTYLDIIIFNGSIA